MSTDLDLSAVRRTVYGVIITLAAGVLAGRILAVARLADPSLYKPADAQADDQRGAWPKARPEPMPTHGDNDRSRWGTIRALVDDGTYAIGKREKSDEEGKTYKDSGIITQDGWKTIDKVLHPERQEFYSSKPPLLPTILAGEYWLLKQAFGWSITGPEERWFVVRTILLTVNWLPLILYWVLLSKLVESYGTTDWGRMYVLGAACFGTFLTTFANTLNNHTVATWSVLFALYPALRVFVDGRREPWLFLVSGLFAGFAATSELPALSFTAMLLGILFLQAPVRTLLLALPAALVPAAAFFWTNYLALGTWELAYEKFGSIWYEFDGSHWLTTDESKMRGIDWAHRIQGQDWYAFHVFVGHHGWFSLTPIFLLSLFGMPALLWYVRRPEQRGLAWLGLLSLVLSAVLFYYYILWVGPRQRNYGGWTTSLRWAIWLTPFWLLSMLPAADWLARRRWGRALGYVLLLISAISASFQIWNPWRHPWIYRLMEGQGMIEY